MSTAEKRLKKSCGPATSAIHCLRFNTTKRHLLLKVGNSVFSETLVSMHLEEDDFRIEGILKLGPFQTVKRTPVSPSIMGFFAYIPNMECYHGVISMNHAIDETVAIGTKRPVILQAAKATLKGLGDVFFGRVCLDPVQSFPGRGHQPFFFSTAKIPFRGSSFEGFICNYRGRRGIPICDL